MLQELASDPELRLDMEFMPGDVQILNNHMILHARTGYEDLPEPEKSAICCGCGCRRLTDGPCRRFSPNAMAASRSATAAVSSAGTRGCTRRWSRLEAGWMRSAEVASLVVTAKGVIARNDSNEVILLGI